MYTYGAERNIEINIEETCSPSKEGRDGAVGDVNVFGSYTFDAKQ